MPAKKTTLPRRVPAPPVVAGGAGAPHSHQQPELRFITAWELYWQNPFRTALELLAEKIIRVDGAREPDRKGGSA